MAWKLRWIDLACLVLFSVALRTAIIAAAPYVSDHDAVFQTLEPGHYLAFGNGLLPWEFALGMRSWVLPGLIAALMRLGAFVGSAPTTILLPVMFALALASATPVICGYLWGERLFDRRGAIVIGIANAVWVDNVYYATQALSEVAAGDCLIVGLFLGTTAGRAPAARLFWCGVTLGLTFVLRFHLAPAIALAVFWMSRRQLAERLPPILAGFCLPVLVFDGGLDWLTLGRPFQSVWLNFEVNILYDVSGNFSVTPWYRTPLFALRSWTIATPLLVWGWVAGGRKLPAGALTALAIFVAHSLIGHKEHRFIYPALPLVATLTAIACVETYRNHARRRPVRPRAGWHETVALGSASVALSLLVALLPGYSHMWLRERTSIVAFDYLSSLEPPPCGVGLYRMDANPTMGQSRLPLDTPLYELEADRFAMQSAAVDTVLALAQTEPPEPRYTLDRCIKVDGDRDFHGKTLCIWRRAGTCDTAAAPPPPYHWPPGIPEQLRARNS